VLRQLAGQVAPAVIAERLGTRTRAAVIARGRLLHISLMSYGEHHPAAKYSDALVEQARTLHDEGIKPRAIAEQLGIPVGAVKSFVYYQHRLGPPVEYYF
jgi:hypothetical protein